MEDARAAAKNDGRLLFQRAAEGKRGEEPFLAIGDAYNDEMLTDPIRLPGQMHVYVRPRRWPVRRWHVSEPV